LLLTQKVKEIYQVYLYIIVDTEFWRDGLLIINCCWHKKKKESTRFIY